MGEEVALKMIADLAEVNIVLRDKKIEKLESELLAANLNYKEADVLRMDAESKLSLALSALEKIEPLLDFISDELGVYPMSVEGGSNPYAERTKEMNEHNDKVMQVVEAEIAIRDCLNQIRGVEK